MLDKIRLIFVEGENDSSFIGWLLRKNNITLSDNKKLIESMILIALIS